MKLFVFSMGQKINSNFDVLIENLSRLSQNKANHEAIRAWIKPHLTLLRLERTEDMGLQRVLEAFNHDFQVEVAYEEFLKNWNAMSLVSTQQLQMLRDELHSMKDLPVQMLWVTHSNHYHLKFLLDQIQAFDSSMAKKIGVLGNAECDVTSKILIATSMHMQTIEHPDTLRQALRHFPLEGEIISCLNTIQRMDDIPDLCYHNPGKQMQHVHALMIEAHLPIYPVRQKWVMSLGDIVTQDRRKAMRLLFPLLQEHNIPKFLAFLNQQEEQGGLIHQFKMGFMDESTFDAKMLDGIQEKTGLSLSVEQFNEIWQSMNPSFQEVASTLEVLNANELRKQGHELKIISYTNCKDIRHWQQELYENDQAYALHNGHLVGFAGFELACSYVEHKSKPELVEDCMIRAHHSHRFAYASAHAAPSVIYVTSSAAMDSELQKIADIPGVEVQTNWDKSTPLCGWLASSAQQTYVDTLSLDTLSI